jgi:hypothetical protein
MKPKASEATVEQLLNDITYWEDPDSNLIVNTTEGGGIIVADHEWFFVGEGTTLKEAIIQFMQRREKRWSGCNEHRKFNYGT